MLATLRALDGAKDWLALGSNEPGIGVLSNHGHCKPAESSRPQDSLLSSVSKQILHIRVLMSV